ncbi:MAG: ABC transporter ATP-binding protein/permease [Clostridiales bacterium]|nr:ABC transporter ATP-binding protein/permease [Clostridiales bacterium]
MERYKKYVIPYWKYFILGPIGMIIEVLGEVLLPWFLSKIQNIGIENQNITFIVAMGVCMIVTAFCMGIGGIMGAYYASKAAMSFGADLRADLFEKIQQFSFQNIDEFSTGSLVTRLTNDITQVQNLIMMFLRLCLRAPGMLIGALIMAFIMNAKLAMVILIVVPILTAAIVGIIKIAFPRFELMQKKIDRLNSGIQESLVNIRVIKSFVRSDFEENKFQKLNQDLKDTSMRAFKVVIFNMPVMMFAMNMTTIAVVWFGGNMIISGDMKLGDLMAFVNYIVQILMSLMMLAMVFLNSSRAVASLKRITEVLDKKIDLTDEDALCKQKEVEHGSIEFKNVKYRYYKNSNEWVLNDINFQIKSGQTVGIIGPTGCGKTTLVSMILRLYDVDEGEVLVDGVDVKQYSLKNLREGVGMVLQKNVLFSGDIMKNLRWGDANASDEEVFEVSKRAQAHDFVITFPDGYATELGQGGSNVSGGQKQRLCIARALLKKPKILILDDSTSAVDTATEAKIRETFYTSLKDATKIIIAQRITSVMDADQIFVMEDGKIVDQGVHAQLLERCEEYREIYDSQMRREVKE